jgi:chemotaxis protein methyltransferase WspC
MAPIIEKIGDLLHERIGLNIESIGRSALEYTVKNRMRSVSSPTLDEYWARLSSPPEVQALVEAIVVPETWFFRHQEAFEGLVNLVMKEWLPHNLGTSLQILSVPCSTGEEPYSIVMALLDAGFPTSHLRMDAIDVSTRALEQAKEGQYRPYSFRSQDTAFRDRYFTTVGELYRIGTEVRTPIQFHEGNVLDLEYLATSHSYDIVFCRNLLIYLHEDSRKAAISNLAKRLKPRGWLFTGAAEAIFFHNGAFRSAGVPGVAAFQKADADSALNRQAYAPLKVEERTAALPLPPRPAPSLITRQAVATTAVKAVPEPASIGAALPADAIREACRQSLNELTALANTGRFDEANHLCQVHLQTYGESAETFYLQALLKDARGEHGDAEAAYRKALYLDPDHVEAMHHLASLLAVRGDEAQARKLRERAGRVAKRQG